MRVDAGGLAVQHTPTEKGPIFFLLVVAKFFSSWLQNVPPRGCKIALPVVAKRTSPWQQISRMKKEDVHMHTLFYAYRSFALYLPLR